MTEKTFIGYEYREISVKRSVANLTVDGYENFGWILEETAADPIKFDCVRLRFKRDRKLKNKIELTRLQRHFDSCVADILSLENTKYILPGAVAYLIGLVGTAFMAGSVFAVTSGLILLCILLAIPAFAGWVAPYFIYRILLKRKTAELDPLIDDKYNEIYDVCERAHHLLNA